MKDNINIIVECVNDIWIVRTEDDEFQEYIAVDKNHAITLAIGLAEIRDRKVIIKPLIDEIYHKSYMNAILYKTSDFIKREIENFGWIK